MGTPLTKEDLADALECFWNAALGRAREANDHTAYQVGAIMVEGVAAVAARLRGPCPYAWAVREIASDRGSRQFEVVLPDGSNHVIYAISYEDALSDAKANWPKGGA